MLNRIMKGSFFTVGALTGITINRIFLAEFIKSKATLGVVISVIISLCLGFIFLLLADKLINSSTRAIDKIENTVERISLYELLLSSIGLIVCLIIANLINVSINKIAVIGLPLSILTNILLGGIGVYLAVSKKNDNIFDKVRGGSSKLQSINMPKILDTSVIIDARILDICRAGFLEGEILIPNFILEELRHLADSSDDLTRMKGRRGLDLINILQKDVKYPIKIIKVKDDETVEVDERLMNYAKEAKAKIITNDYNLNKVASIKIIPILNINDLANAVKPIAATGEEINIKVIKEGKENGQGVGYLEDGTMIVIEGGSKFKGDTIDVIVTSVFQTSAGRMIFAKPKTEKFVVVK